MYILYIYVASVPVLPCFRVLFNIILLRLANMRTINYAWAISLKTQRDRLRKLIVHIYCQKYITRENTVGLEPRLTFMYIDAQVCLVESRLRQLIYRLKKGKWVVSGVVVLCCFVFHLHC